MACLHAWCTGACMSASLVFWLVPSPSLEVNILCYSSYTIHHQVCQCCCCCCCCLVLDQPCLLVASLHTLKLCKVNWAFQAHCGCTFVSGSDTAAKLYQLDGPSKHITWAFDCLVMGSVEGFEVSMLRMPITFHFGGHHMITSLLLQT